MSDAPDRLIPLGEVKQLVGLGHSKIYALISAGAFPRPVKLGSASRWSETEVREWVSDRLATRSAA